ncbi:ABC transporter ATP-binding protein [Ramlibacter sp. RBP-2]|uniref:ABC transporter ATP-binding protein n=1 Tax=Ramlibacter lithotrophicus TaxID=2606681 RepID=A0A7X6DFW0_9BURK|nr:ATP-binding cassette domain-containing protein [Ramlibacter lithotrophicus]NKE66419.1 ABC transporter ATP-binding protein [Ramlibacter lithotrophicus]
MNLSDAPVHEAALAIEAVHLGKAYRPNASPAARLRAALLGREIPGDSFWALRDVSLQVRKGESLGLIGNNGAGKSTLLQLLCGTVTPTTGTVRVDGRVAALLELGAGFNPDFSGRDNVLLNGPLLGLGRAQLLEQMDSIIEFSGIGHFIDQPVKTYSSGMFVRLAFALATSVEPDILVIDEALSVGDGGFARKSFDRILAMKERGTTILFCSHSLYQIEAFCDRVLWLHEGKAMAVGPSHAVVRDYTLFLAGGSPEVPAPGAPVAVPSAEESAAPLSAPVAAPPADPEAPAPVATPVTQPGTATPGHARIRRVVTSLDGVASTRLQMTPGQGTLRVSIEFDSDPGIPMPTAGMTFELANTMILSSVVSRTDKVMLERDAQGRGTATIEFGPLALRKGDYYIGAYLGNENAIHLYSEAARIALLSVTDPRPEPGLVDLPHTWRVEPGHVED